MITEITSAALIALSGLMPVKAQDFNAKEPALRSGVVQVKDNDRTRDFCGAPKTKIAVNPKSKPVKYDFSKTYADIQHQASGTVNPYGFENVTFTNGYMQGQISYKLNATLNGKGMPRNDGNCLWYEKINVDFHLEPLIVIAKEVREDKCMFKAVREHELKHVRVDRQIVNRYSRIIAKRLYEGLKQRGFVVSHIRTHNIDSTKQRMEKTIKQILDLEFKELEITRARLQQKVDSLEEYKRVQAKCPDFSPPQSAIDAMTGN